MEDCKQNKHRNVAFSTFPCSSFQNSLKCICYSLKSHTFVEIHSGDIKAADKKINDKKDLTIRSASERCRLIDYVVHNNFSKHEQSFLIRFAIYHNRGLLTVVRFSFSYLKSFWNSLILLNRKKIIISG